MEDNEKISIKDGIIAVCVITTVLGTIISGMCVGIIGGAELGSKFGVKVANAYDKKNDKK